MSEEECASLKSGIFISRMSSVMAKPKTPSQKDSSRSLPMCIIAFAKNIKLKPVLSLKVDS